MCLIVKIVLFGANSYKLAIGASELRSKSKLYVHNLTSYRPLRITAQENQDFELDLKSLNRI